MSITLAGKSHAMGNVDYNTENEQGFNSPPANNELLTKLKKLELCQY